MSLRESVVLQAGPPCWDRGLWLADLLGRRDPNVEARAAVDIVTKAIGGKGGLPVAGAVGVVDGVFTLVQLALDDRHGDGKQKVSSPAEKTFRSALAPGALGLVTRLVTALQPREHLVGDEVSTLEEAGDRGGIRDAVVTAARHLSAMEKLVAGQNNTSALLIAHNGLAKLLKGRWSWLVGGVLDAPRLLRQLCSIYRDGLSQLKVALADTGAKSPSGRLLGGNGTNGVAGEQVAAAAAAEVAHLKKFGKLLATFGTRMSCLLRHLGPECDPREGREACRLFAQAAGSVFSYRDCLSHTTANDVTAKNENTIGRVGSAEPSSARSSLAGVMAGLVYPRAVESFLSAAGPAPCAHENIALSTKSGQQDANSSSSNGIVNADVNSTVEANEIEMTCRCYEGSQKVSTDGEVEAGDAKTSANTSPLARSERRKRQHDPWKALAALRPRAAPPVRRITRDCSTDRARSGGSSNAVMGRYEEVNRNERVGGDEDEAGSGAPSDDHDFSVGAVVILCAVLRSEQARLSTMVFEKLGECCGWVLDHLATLFPALVEAAVAREQSDVACADGQHAKEHAGCDQERVYSALCREAAIALAFFVGRRAVNGEFDEAQIQLLEGCACHPHPLCREIWCNALKVFCSRCDDAAQQSLVRTFTEAALDPKVSPRCRRRLGRAIHGLILPTGEPLSTVGTKLETYRENGTRVDGPSSSVLCQSARYAIEAACLLRLNMIPAAPAQSGVQEEANIAKSGTTKIGTSVSSSADSDSFARGSEADDARSSAGGACALDLLGDVSAPLLATISAGDPSAAPCEPSPRCDNDIVVSLANRAQHTRLLAQTSLKFAHDIVNSYARSHLKNRGSAVRTVIATDPKQSSTSAESRNSDETVALTAACRFLSEERLLKGDGRDARTEGVLQNGGRKNSDEAVVAAKETGRMLGGAMTAAGRREIVELAEPALRAVVRVLIKLNPGSLPQLCVWMAECVGRGGAKGAGLLAIADGLSCMGRQPFPTKQSEASAWEATLSDGFSALFGAGSWPVTTSAMQALEVLARHADPRTARLLRELVPGDRLLAFKARLARRIVTLEGNMPVEGASIRERGAIEWRILAAAAAATAADPDRAADRLRKGNTINPGLRGQRQVTLREGGDFTAIAGFLSSTIVRIDVLDDEAGGGVCITLER